VGKSGAYRQSVLNRQSLLKAASHESRRDKTGQLRSVDNVAPLVWSDGQIAEPGNWSSDGWDSSLVADYEKHVAGAKRDKRAVASGKLAVHAFLQFPTDIEMTPENEALILQNAVDFTNKIHGGDAVFHARLDRDESGKHGVDVFFAPKFEKKTGRNKEKSETWISLTKFEKEEAKKRGFIDAGPRARGRMLQDAFAEHLRDEMGLDWVERGEHKVTFVPDRLEPEELKLQIEREKIFHREFLLSEREKKVFKKEIDLNKKESNLNHRENILGEKVLIVNEANKKAVEDRYLFNKKNSFLDVKLKEINDRQYVEDSVSRAIMGGFVFDIVNSETKKNEPKVIFTGKADDVYKKSFLERISGYGEAAVKVAKYWAAAFNALVISSSELEALKEKAFPRVNEVIKKRRDGFEM